MRIRLATFNIENLGRRNGAGPDVAARRPTLQAQLARLDADILCLQEVNAQEAGTGAPRAFRDLDAVLDGTAYAGFHRAHTRGKRGAGPIQIHNLVTLSRWPIRRSRQLWNDLVAPPGYVPRGAAASTERSKNAATGSGLRKVAGPPATSSGHARPLARRSLARTGMPAASSMRTTFG